MSYTKENRPNATNEKAVLIQSKKGQENYNMASVTKKHQGYLIRITNGKDANGKRIYINEMYHPTAKSETARKNEAQKYADELERRIKNGEAYNLQGLTLNDFYQKWKTELAPNYLTQSVREQYMDIMEKRFLPVLGNINIANIQPLVLQEMITAWDKKENLKPRSIKGYTAVLSSVMHQAYNMRLIKENPVSRLMLPKVTTDTEEIHTFTAEQARAFLNGLEDEYTIYNKKHERTLKINGKRYSVPSYTRTVTISRMWIAYFYLALLSGARRGECITLTWRDIDFAHNTIYITKATAITKSGQITKDPKTKAGKREIMLPSAVFAKLSEWKQEQRKHAEEIGDEWKGETGVYFDKNYIFTQDNGKQLDAHTPTHKFKEIIAMYNNSVSETEKLPDITLHDLRHCTASLLIASGIDVAEVTRMLGHSKISMTLDTYTHALRGRSEHISNTLETLLTVKEESEATAIMA